MEHAHIKELEQSLLFEKTKADKLQRELEDTRVMDSAALPCALFCREKERGERQRLLPRNTKAYLFCRNGFWL